MQHGTAAQAPAPKASDKYGAFTGWTADISSVTSNMVVTPVYENSPKISVDLKNLDDPSSGTFNLGDHVFVTISDNESGEYRVTAPGFDSGFGNSREFSFMLTSSGTNSIRVEKRLSDGTVFTALSKNISVARAVTVYYSGFSAPNIHYCVQNGTWTAVPGMKMNASSSVSGYTHRYVIPLTNATDTTVKCCFNDGNNNWDNNNQNDYTLTEGVFGIKNGSVTDLTK